MLTTHYFLNSTLNQVHRWNAQEQNLMTRIFLTRLSESVIAALEASSFVFKLIAINLNIANQCILFSSKAVLIILPHSKFVQHYAKRPLDLTLIKFKGLELCRLIAGLACTIFIGVIFPETNFKIHLKLNLAVDNLAQKTQKKLAAKFRAELKKAEITRARTKRFSELEAKQMAAKQLEREANVVNPDLAHLLFPHGKKRDEKLS